MTTPEGETIDRLPAWIKRVTQDLNYSPVYDAIFWNPPEKYVFKNKPPPRPLSVRVYEAHGPTPLIGANSSWYLHHRVSSGYIPGIHQKRPPQNQETRIQCNSTHGNHGTCVLCFLWISSHLLLCRFISLWSFPLDKPLTKAHLKN